MVSNALKLEAEVGTHGLPKIPITDQLIIATFACTSVSHIPFGTAIRQTYWDLKVGNNRDTTHDFANIPLYAVTSAI